MTNSEFEQEDNLNLELNCETRQQMAGLEQEIEQDENPSSVIETDVDTGGRHLTKPLSKACFTFIAVGAALGVPAIITFSLVNAFLSKPDTQRVKQVTTPIQKEDVGKLKTEVAQIRSRLGAEKLEAQSKPEPTPESAVKVEVPISKQPEPVAEKTPIPQPPATITPEPILIPPALKPKPSITQEPPTPIDIPPAPQKPIERIKVVKVPTPVKNATKPKTVQTTQNPNPVRFWQQAANYGFAVYTPKTPISKTPQQPKQRAVQVTASLPAQKARSKVIKKTYALTKEQRIRRHLKTNSLAKSNFKPQKRLQIKSVSAMEAMQPINAEVAKGYGLFINFRQLEEEVTGVLVGDPTQITFHHNNGFVFIRQIKPINFPSITRSADGETQLVVLTNSQYGSKQYVFRLMPVKGSTRYSGIVLKPNQQRLIQPQPTSDFTNTI